MNDSVRPPLPAPARKPINPAEVSKFVSGAAESGQPPAVAPAAAVLLPEKAPVAEVSLPSPLVPTVGAGDTITLTLSLKRKPTVGTRGKSQLFRVTENENQLVQAVLAATKFKSAQEIFEVLYVGGIKVLAKQLAASDPEILKLLEQENDPEGRI